MVEFALRSRAPRWCVSVAALHGLTDFRHPLGLWPYFLLLLPMPGQMVTGAFLAASVCHFGSDLTFGGSLALHALFASVARAGGLEPAFDVALAYLSCVHTPLHYYRVTRDGGVCSAATCLILSALACPLVPRVLPVTHIAQKAVVAHVVSNRCLRT